MNDSVNSKKPTTFKFKVLHDMFETPNRYITGREILAMANLTPPELYKLDLRMKGNRYRNVGLDDEIDLSEPGIEMFTYIKKDQTEG